MDGYLCIRVTAEFAFISVKSQRRDERKQLAGGRLLWWWEKKCRPTARPLHAH